MKGKIISNLDLLTHTKCFRLVDETSTILEKGDCSGAKNSGEIYLFRPYGQKLVEKIILVYE
jgi:hypothetical protein